MQELTLKAFISMFKIKNRNYKCLGANHSKFVTKEFNKAIMLGSKLRKMFLKDRTEESRCKCKKERSVSEYLLKKPKKD